jgi:hypothetical protein
VIVRANADDIAVEVCRGLGSYDCGATGCAVKATPEPPTEIVYRGEGGKDERTGRNGEGSDARHISYQAIAQGTLVVTRTWVGMANNKNHDEQQPGENPDGKFHYNPGNMAGKKPGTRSRRPKTVAKPNLSRKLQELLMMATMVDRSPSAARSATATVRSPNDQIHHGSGDICASGRRSSCVARIRSSSRRRRNRRVGQGGSTACSALIRTCASQVWPNFDASCLRNGDSGASVKQARLVTAAR